MEKQLYILAPIDIQAGAGAIDFHAILFTFQLGRCHFVQGNSCGVCKEETPNRYNERQTDRPSSILLYFFP